MRDRCVRVHGNGEKNVRATGRRNVALGFDRTGFAKGTPVFSEIFSLPPMTK